MGIRLSGLSSGMDTESIVDALVSAYSTKKDKYTKAQTKLSWTMSAWQTTNTKVYSFYTNSLSAMRYSSGYNVKKATSSNTSYATVSANNTAVNGTQSLSISQLATSGYLTGGKVSSESGSTVTKSSTLGELGLSGGSISVNGTDISLSESMTVSSLMNKMKDAGVNANFDETNQRIFISSKKSGAEGEFTITANDSDGLSAIKSLGLLSVKDTNGNETADMAKYREIAAMSSDDEIDAKYEKSKYTTESYTKYIQGLVSSAESSLATTQSKLDELTAEDYDWSSKYDTEEDYNNAVSELEEKVANYQSVIDTNNELLNDSDKLQAAMDEANASIRSNIVSSVDSKIATAQAILADTSLTNSSDSARITAQDSIIKLNGATFTGTTNNFTINGLTINATAVTTDADGNDNPITITTETDSQGIYDKIKSLLSEYNDMISYLDGLYYAESASGYEPLTDDEKESLTDTQIEEWEKKIKDSLLRRDSTIGSISSSLKTIASTTTYTDSSGKSYNLSSFGIATQSYFSAAQADRGKLHIDGDEDDSLTSSNTDKLMEAITNDPDAVVNYFQTLAQNMYKTLTNKMSSSSLSSAFTIYNDKEMSSQYSDYDDKIDEWDDRLTDYEDYWYSKFSAMETSLSKLQSQTSSLSSLLGS